MQESLIEKAQRLGIKPAGAPTQATPSVPSESLLQKAQRLGITPESERPKIGGLQSFIQSVAKPALKLTSTVSNLGAESIGLGAELLGKKDFANRLDNSIQNAKDEGIDYGYFGSVKSLGSNTKSGEILSPRDVMDAIGTGAELGSYAIGGGGATGVVKAGLGGLIKQGAKEGIKVGAASGGVLGFGQSMQDAESSPMDVAYNTLFGAGVGGATGGLFGAVTPVVTKGVNTVRSATNLPKLEQKLADSYKKIFNPTARQVKVDSRFGNDSFKFLAEEMPDLPVKVNSSGRIEADEAIEMAKLKYSSEAAAYKPIIRNSGKYVDVDDAIVKMKTAAKRELDGTDLMKAENQIDDEINAYLANNPQDVNVLASGKRMITLSRADDIKSYSWARGKGWGTPEAEVWNDTNNIIGHTFKDAIEKELPNAPIKAMNKRLGQWKNAIDMLERRNAQVSGSGGKLGKYLIKTAGTTIGATLGGDGGLGTGIGGATTGFVTASALAAALANPNIRLFVVRKLINNLNKAGRKDLIDEAEQILKGQAEKYLLPAAGKSSYVEEAIKLPTSARETTLGLNEVRNMNKGQSIPKTPQISEPIQAPIKQESKKVIKNNVSQESNSVNKNVDKDLKEVSGGLAGVEVKKDEKGDTKVTFSPTKALVGVAGMNLKNTLFKTKVSNYVMQRIAKSDIQYIVDNMARLKKGSPLSGKTDARWEEFLEKLKVDRTLSPTKQIVELQKLLDGNRDIPSFLQKL